MRLLTATSATQGSRSDDFYWCTEGELVWVHEDTADEEDPADVSGIARSWIGLSSHRATTTARVSDLPFSQADVRLALRGYLESAGFARFLQPWELERILDDEVAMLIRLGRRYPSGSVVERRGPYMRARPSGGLGQADVA
jgi:hypothetical protein